MSGCKKSTSFIGILILTFATLPSYGQPAGTVVPAKHRTELIISLEKALATPPATEFTQSLQGIKNPFVREMPEKAVVVSDDNIEEIPEQQREVILADKVILEAAANNLRPQGALETAERSLLRTNRGLLRVNDTIKVSVNGREYTVVVHEITAEDYTLRTGDTLYKSSFSRIGSTGEIRLYQPTEEPTETP